MKGRIVTVLKGQMNASQIAEKLNVSVDEVMPHLKEMVKKKVLFSDKELYSTAPFKK